MADNPDDPFNTNAGGQLKEVENSHWIDPNEGATNTKGFTGLPGGHIVTDKMDISIGWVLEAFWWSSDAEGIQLVLHGVLSTDDENIHWYNSDKSFGKSVRCVKDGGSLKKRLPGKVDYNPVILKPGK